ncbi:hypothetical protein GQX74_009296 [Glossina fuscipes]|nr:hypothetical protein GQX74_009296 [Glossina fuscipes]
MRLLSIVAASVNSDNNGASEVFTEIPLYLLKLCMHLNTYMAAPKNFNTNFSSFPAIISSTLQARSNETGLANIFGLRPQSAKRLRSSLESTMQLIPKYFLYEISRNRRKAVPYF